MGCDIHLHPEVKIHGKWHHYGCGVVKRNYELFEKMAGVRGSARNAIAPPKGLPFDISDLTRFDLDLWDCDAHSHSWLNAEEIAILQDWWEEKYGHSYFAWPELQWGYLFGDTWGSFFQYPENRPGRLEDVRFVFWFDN